jgi:putative membrane protein
VSEAARPALARVSDRAFYAFVSALSVVALSFLAYILLLRPASSAQVDVSFLPAVNASLNAVAASLLCAGFVAIRLGARRVHKFFMVSAFVASSLFLVCYVTYHSVHGDTHFHGVGWVRGLYFTLLISHILLSAVTFPLTVTTLFFAARGTFARHRRLARWTLPLWLYVSVTGVAIFFFLRNNPP